MQYHSITPMKRLCLAAVFLFFASSLLWGQSLTDGTISGTIVDETGGILPGVSVETTNTETGITRSAVTDDKDLVI